MRSELRNRSKKVRGDSRTILKKGYGDDEGIYYTCWYCKFTCKEGRDKLGGPESENVILHEVETVNATGAEPGNPLSALSVLDGDIRHYQVALKSDSDGNGIVPKVGYLTNSSPGCPQCHSLNWRGDF